MLKKELEKEIKRLSEDNKRLDELGKIFKADNGQKETQVKELREKNVRLEVINRDNADALKASTIYIKMLLRNMYT